VTSPFLVPVGALLRHPGTTREVSFRATFDRDGQLAATWPGAAEVVPGADVEVRLTLTSYLGGVEATGVLLAPWRASCRRCAGDVEGVLEARVTERFSPGAGPDDDDAYPLADETVDLTPLVRDAVVLELPLAPLCRDGCAGLCPTCGADRNLAPCTCQENPDPRWATLDALRVPGQG
jgi:uncharacterized protein